MSGAFKQIVTLGLQPSLKTTSTFKFFYCWKIKGPFRPIKVLNIYIIWNHGGRISELLYYFCKIWAVVWCFVGFKFHWRCATIKSLTSSRPAPLNVFSKVRLENAEVLLLLEMSCLDCVGFESHWKCTATVRNELLLVIGHSGVRRFEGSLWWFIPRKS